MFSIVTAVFEGTLAEQKKEVVAGLNSCLRNRVCNDLEN
jgi:hypothetical protein